MIDDLFRRRPHVRSAEVEELLASVSNPFNAFSNSPQLADQRGFEIQATRSSTGEELPLTHGTEGSLLYSTDREVRRTGVGKYADGFISVKNALAAGLAGAMKRDVFYMRARRFDNVLGSAAVPVQPADQCVLQPDRDLQEAHPDMASLLARAQKGARRRPTAPV